MKKNRKVSPEEALQFLEDFRKILAEKDEPTVAVSIRIPANILRMIKAHAKHENKKYQSMIIEILRKSMGSRI